MRDIIEKTIAKATNTTGKSGADAALERLRGVVEARAILDDVEIDYAREARDGGKTWLEVADAAGLKTAGGAVTRYREKSAADRRKVDKAQRADREPAEPLPGESAATIAEREGLDRATLVKRIEAGLLPQYEIVEALYRGRPAKRIKVVG